MAKLKTKKIKKSFSEEILEILKLEGLVLTPTQEISISERFIEYFNTMYKPKEPQIEFWDKIVTHYFDFYSELNNGIKPAFVKSDPKSLKDVSTILKNRFLLKTKNGNWTEQIAIARHNEFYNQVIRLPFARKNFSITYIYNNFDKIISELISSSTINNINKINTTPTEEEVMEWLKKK